MTDHYMVEPTACSPAAGWEKGQVEQQVQTIRGRFFQPRLRFASLAELNGWLEAECRRWAAHHAHPERSDITVAEALEMEDRKSVVRGKGVSVRIELGGRRILKNKTNSQLTHTHQ